MSAGKDYIDPMSNAEESWEKQLFDEPHDRMSLDRLLKRLGIEWWFYQSFGAASLQTIDQMPPHFLQAYYENDIDDVDPIATAIRARLPLCSFTNARSSYAETLEGAEKAKKFLEKWHILDGLFVTTGTEDHQAVLVLIAAPAIVRQLMRERSRYLRVFAIIADEALYEAGSQLTLKRRRWQFTEREKELLLLALSGKCNTLTQQALALSISEATVKQRRARICKRVGVRSWPGVLASVKDRLL